jgi:hypothetical protein
MSRRMILVPFACAFFHCFLYGQSAQVTNNALFRTFMIETTVGRGTTFSIDVDNREYWITAKHVFTGKRTGPAGEFKTKTVQANVLSGLGNGDEGHDQSWKTVQFQAIDPGKDIDILILVPDHLLLPYDRDFNLRTDSPNIGFGGDCEFLGFPYGGGWKIRRSSSNEWVWLPYTKHCTVSARVEEGGLGIWVLDGINNEGFSGGPVLSQTGPSQRVFAVISGFHQEPLEVMPEPAPGQTQASSVPPPPELPGQQSSQRQVVEANSGFILAFDIQPAIKAIQANPIGPLRPEAPLVKKSN